MSSPSLPAAPSLEQLRKQAKELLRAHRAGDAGAIARVAAHHPHPEKPVKLAGTSSSSRASTASRAGRGCAPTSSASPSTAPRSSTPTTRTSTTTRAGPTGCCESAQDGTPGAVAAFERRRRPDDRGRRAHGGGPPARLRDVGGAAPPRRGPARVGRAVRPRLPRHRGARRRRPARSSSSASPSSWPRVGTNGNDLLGMAGATCDERLVARPARARRRPVARQRARLDAAAPGGLLATSRCWPGCCSTPARRSTSRPAATAARRWSSRCSGAIARWPSCWPSAACSRATCAPRPGSGASTSSRSSSRRTGRLAPEAGAHRGFYRPHSGFPAWRPSDDPQEVLDEALAWAARSDRVEVLEPLVARGARLDADVYRGSALDVGGGQRPRRRGPHGCSSSAPTRAAARRSAARRTARASRRCTSPPRTATSTPCAALLDAGADPRARDANFDATPDGWAEHGGHPEVAAAIRGA